MPTILALGGPGKSAEKPLRRTERSSGVWGGWVGGGSDPGRDRQGEEEGMEQAGGGTGSSKGAGGAAGGQWHSLRKAKPRPRARGGPGWLWDGGRWEGQRPVTRVNGQYSGTSWEK